jgi:phosphoribosylformylglycinamidine synthase
MVSIFHLQKGLYYLLKSKSSLSKADTDKFKWLFNEAELLKQDQVKGFFIGPRKEMITPWSTNAVEIAQNMGIEGVE